MGPAHKRASSTRWPARARGCAALSLRTSRRAAITSSIPASSRSASRASPSLPSSVRSIPRSSASPRRAAGDRPRRADSWTDASSRSRAISARAGSTASTARKWIRRTSPCGGRPAARIERCGKGHGDDVARLVDREGAPQVFELCLPFLGGRSTTGGLHVGVRGRGGRHGIGVPCRQRAKQLGGERVRRIDGNGGLERCRRSRGGAGACLEDPGTHEHVRGLLRFHIRHRRDGLERQRGAGRFAKALEPRRHLATQLDVLP